VFSLKYIYAAKYIATGHFSINNIKAYTRAYYSKHLSKTARQDREGKKR
jgi:hypothetical protein